MLGSGAFVERLREEDALSEKLPFGVSLDELLRRVATCYGLAPEQLSIRTGNRAVAAARDVFCHVAVRRFRFVGTEVGKTLGIGRSAVSHAVRRGEALLVKSPDLQEKILLN